MSKYDTQTDENDAICPYCGYRYQVEPEDYSDERNIENCEKCGKKFYTWQVFSVTTYTEPGCKINNQEHDFQPSGYDDIKARFCSVCGEIERKG